MVDLLLALRISVFALALRTQMLTFIAGLALPRSEVAPSYVSPTEKQCFRERANAEVDFSAQEKVGIERSARP